MKLLSSKRGNWQDIIEYSVGILVLGITFLVVYLMLSSFNTQLINGASTGGIMNDSIALERMNTTTTSFPANTDWIIPLIYVFFLGFSVWGARLIPSSHKFVFIGWIMFVVVLLFSLFIETMWDAFITTTLFSGSVASFPLTNFFISYLRYFVLLYGLFIGVALYAKNE